MSATIVAGIIVVAAEMRVLLSQTAAFRRIAPQILEAAYD
jgi:hypothetical protein